MGKNKEGATSAEGEVAKGKLSLLRPSERVFFFLAFLAVNVWFVVVFDPCTPARKKKRTDCGWSGISPLQCQTGGCFLQPGKSDKVTVELANPSQDKYGLKVTKTGDEIFVKEVTSAGAVSAHNANLTAGSDMVIKVGDKLSKLNGHTGANIQSELSRKKAKAKFEIHRPSSAIARNVPAFLNDYMVAQVLKSAGFERWLDAFSKIGGVGVFSWYLSGFPVASLPVYYLGVSAVTSWYAMRCCHDEKGAKQGDPHCFSTGVTDFESAIVLAYNQTTKKRAQNLFGWVPS